MGRTRPPGPCSPRGGAVGVVDRVPEVPVDHDRPAIGRLIVAPDRRVVVPLIPPVVVGIVIAHDMIERLRPVLCDSVGMIDLPVLSIVIRSGAVRGFRNLAGIGDLSGDEGCVSSGTVRLIGTVAGPITGPVMIAFIHGALVGKCRWTRGRAIVVGVSSLAFPAGTIVGLVGAFGRWLVCRLVGSWSSCWLVRPVSGTIVIVASRTVLGPVVLPLVRTRCVGARVWLTGDARSGQRIARALW